MNRETSANFIGSIPLEDDVDTCQELPAGRAHCQTVWLPFVRFLGEEGISFGITAPDSGSSQNGSCTFEIGEVSARLTDQSPEDAFCSLDLDLLPREAFPSRRLSAAPISPAT